MSSLVKDFQKDIVQSQKSTTELLRTAKLIAAKLQLADITGWIEAELTGYKTPVPQFPDYRCFNGGDLFIRNPVRGWQASGRVKEVFRVGQAIPELESVRKSDFVYIPLSQNEHYRITDQIGRDISDWQQQIHLSKTELEGLLQGVRDKLLDWSIELEQRGIVGENMSFDEKEKQSAQNQTFNIQHFTGVLGNVSGSTVHIYDYSSIHKVLKQQNVPQGRAQRARKHNGRIKGGSTCAEAGTS